MHVYEGWTHFIPLCILASLPYITNVFVTACASAATVIPEPEDTTVYESTINTETLLATLSSEVDYEVATAYPMIIQVVDVVKTPQQTGQLTLKVDFFKAIDPYLLFSD